MVLNIQILPADKVKINNEAENLLLDELDKTGICGKLIKGFTIPGLVELKDCIINKNGKWRRDEKKNYFRQRKESITIDAIGKPESGDITYIIEAKRELKNNKVYEAIGQVFVYEYIYKEDPVHPEHKQENTRKVIVCKKVNNISVLNFCKAKGIDVIEITDKNIKKNGEVAD